MYRIFAAMKPFLSTPFPSGFKLFRPYAIIITLNNDVVKILDAPEKLDDDFESFDKTEKCVDDVSFSENIRGSTPTNVADGFYLATNVADENIPATNLATNVADGFYLKVNNLMNKLDITGEHGIAFSPNHLLKLIKLPFGLTHPLRTDIQNFSSKAEEPTNCLWCGDTIGSGCEVNFCKTLKFPTLRKAVNYLMRPNRYGCSHHNRFFVGPEALKNHFKQDHSSLFENGYECECGAFFVDDTAFNLHKERLDELRCAHVPNENSEQREKRIKLQQWKAKRVDIELKNLGY